MVGTVAVVASIGVVGVEAAVAATRRGWGRGLEPRCWPRIVVAVAVGGECLVWAAGERLEMVA